MSEVIVTLSTVAVCLIITAFYLYILFTIRKQTIEFGQGPIHDRSQKLIFLASLSNYIEILCNIMSALILYHNNRKITLPLKILISLSIFFTRFYASAMALRAYHISILHNYRVGEKPFTNISELSILKKLMIIILIYSIATTIPAIILYSYRSDESVFNIYNRVIYGLEGTFFLLTCFYIMKTTVHPSILVEHIFYSFLWALGGLSSEKTLEDRWFFIIPIRNLCLVYISYLSLRVHFNLIRPPLPHDPIFSQIFEIKELYESFFIYLNIYSSIQPIEACILCKELAKCRFCGNMVPFFKFIKSSSYSATFSESLKVGNIEYIQDNLENILKPYKMQYLLSSEYISLKRKYFIIYN